MKFYLTSTDYESTMLTRHPQLYQFPISIEDINGGEHFVIEIDSLEDLERLVDSLDNEVLIYRSQDYVKDSNGILTNLIETDDILTIEIYDDYRE